MKIGKWIDLHYEYDKWNQIYKGKYQNGQKVGLWKTLRKQNNLFELEGCMNYDLNGKEIFRSGENSNIIQMGEFDNGKKVGKWRIWCRENSKYQQIGGGSYDEGGNGIKIGKWIALDDNFNACKQLSYVGEYNYGKKVGRWDIWFKEYEYGCFKQNIQIGGGSYDEEGKEIKIGRWIVLDDQFGAQKQVTYIGEYGYCKKIGRWDTNHRQQLIGGGQYDDGGNGSKIGQWIEISEDYQLELQVTYNGEYINGKKDGRWDIWFKEQGMDGQNNKIGGGSYDGSNRIKIGMWIELDKEFCRCKQLTYNGVYENGKKVGIWNIWFKDQRKDTQNTKIGGGSYDDGGNEMKIGKWIELHYEFDKWNYITNKGIYQNGSKVGLWKTFRKQNNVFELEGCINYDLNGKEIFRSGDYFVGHNYFRNSNFIQMGEFDNGKKVGKWKIWFKENSKYQQIGGGSYDDGGNEMKIGKWIALDDDFQADRQLSYVGEYHQNKKVGSWDIWFKEQGNDEQNTKIGGGLYDNASNEMKNGIWRELEVRYYRKNKVTYNGEYIHGKKSGRWDTYKCDELIGGGSYDEDGVKIGMWIELNVEFQQNNLIIYQGEYKIGKKVGRWDVKIRWKSEKQFKSIGYGSFDEGGKGIQIMKWVYLEDGFRQRNNILYNYESWMKIEVIQKTRY